MTASSPGDADANDSHQALIAAVSAAVAADPPPVSPRRWDDPVVVGVATVLAHLLGWQRDGMVRYAASPVVAESSRSSIYPCGSVQRHDAPAQRWQCGGSETSWGEHCE
jgi:hypothetical protein